MKARDKSRAAKKNDYGFMSAIPVIAVFDVGKTNKKIFLFDRQYKIALEQTVKLAEITDEDGDACENVEVLSVWLKETFKVLMSSEEYSIEAINFSSYGASFVHIDEDGSPALPLYNYLKPFPADLKKKFYETYGGEKKISKETASPVLGNLNSGLQLYRLKYQRQLLDKKGVSLHLPQYLSFLLTGKAFSDITSIGCHTMLWNFEEKAYHEWVRKEKILERLAPVFPSDEVITAEKNIPVGVGLHDSSSALIPYLASFHQPFVLISTGTWCISLNPFNEMPLTDEELEKDCLSFLTYKGKPVKASRLFAGHEHEVEIQRIAEHFDKPLNYFETVTYSAVAVAFLQDQWEQDMREDFRPGSSRFHERELVAFGSYEEAYHQLIMDIMRQQILSTNLVIGNEGVNRIFVDGGFGKNPIYMNLLALAYPDVEVYAASVAQATAIGAALAIHRHWNPEPVPADLIDLKYYSPSRLSP